MLFDEFLNGTGAQQNSDSAIQYELINALYMNGGLTSKEDAYALWKKLYGPKSDWWANKVRKNVERYNLFFSSFRSATSELSNAYRVKLIEAFARCSKVRSHKWTNSDGVEFEFIPCQDGDKNYVGSLMTNRNDDTEHPWQIEVLVMNPSDPLRGVRFGFREPEWSHNYWSEL